MRREKTQNSKIRNKKRGQNNKHQGNPGNHQRFREPIFKYIAKKEMDKFLDT
jgi:hypothetical protein